MKRLATLFSVLTALASYALEVLCIPTLAINIQDQIQYVMTNRGIHIPLAGKVEAGQPFTLYTAVASREKLKQPLKLTATLTVKDPDGKEKNALQNVPLFNIPAGASGVFSSGSYIRGVFEPEDKLGKYSYTLTLKDDNGKTFRAESSLELVSSVIDRKTMDAEEFNKFAQYYRSPRPGRLLAAWEYYLNDGSTAQRKKEGKNFNPMAILCGFAELFKINPQFHDELTAMSRKAPSGKHGYYAVVFAALGKEFLDKNRKNINPEIIKLTDSFKGKDPFAFIEVSHASQLDVLWMKFFTTGKFEPVKRLTDELRERPVLSVEEAKKMRDEGKNLSDKDKKMLLNGIIRMAAAWSLKSNLDQDHRLLGFYMETILARKMYADKLTAAFINAMFKKYNSKKGNKK